MKGGIVSYQNVSPTEAKELLEGDAGAVYIDVRSIPEYEGGHPAGAFNIPIMQRHAAGMVPNLNFVQVVQANFATDAKLLVGCQSGARSMRACEALVATGFTDVANVTAGFGGSRTERGWLDLGFPVESGASDDKGYAALSGDSGA